MPFHVGHGELILILCFCQVVIHFISSETYRKKLSVMKKYILFKLSDSTWKIVIVCHGNEVCIWEIVIVFSL